MNSIVPNPMDQPRMPEFTAPEPSRLQNLAMRAAGVLMGQGRNADPVVTVHEVVTKVGGFELSDTIGRKGLYVHGNTERVHSRDPEGAWRTSDRSVADFTARTGGHLDDALAATLNGRFGGIKGEKPTWKQKTATKLVDRAVKRVGLRAYKKAP